MSSKEGGTRMAKPSPKNRNHVLVLQIPSRACFRGGGGGATSGEARDGELARVRVREDMEMAPVWMMASRLEKEEGILGLGFRGGGFREEEGRR